MMVPGCCGGPSYENASPCMTPTLCAAGVPTPVKSFSKFLNHGPMTRRARKGKAHLAPGLGFFGLHKCSSRPSSSSPTLDQHCHQHVRPQRQRATFRVTFGATSTMARSPKLPASLAVRSIISRRSCLRAETGKVDGNGVEIPQISPSDLSLPWMHMVKW
jgi:hypothetical protein